MTAGLHVYFTVGDSPHETCSHYWKYCAMTLWRSARHEVRCWQTWAIFVQQISIWSLVGMILCCCQHLVIMRRVNGHVKFMIEFNKKGRSTRNFWHTRSTTLCTCTTWSEKAEKSVASSLKVVSHSHCIHIEHIARRKIGHTWINVQKMGKVVVFKWNFPRYITNESS